MPFENNRRLHLRVYFSDSPIPLEITEARHMQTEGELLRIIGADGTSQWWPLRQVFNIREIPERQDLNYAAIMAEMGA